jgi:SAM-dependent methyltransferase
MDAAGRYWAECLARSVDFSRRRLLLDVGGGSGVYSIAIARRHPALRAIVFDLPPVLEVARERIRGAGLEARVSTAAGDFFADPWPEGADAVLFSSVLHDWSPETCRRLLRKAADALPRGGLLVVREMFADDEGPGPLYAAMSSVTMLLETEGENYPWRAYESWLEAAGFGGFRRVPFRTTAGSGALVARRL